jgi:CheY-like chemotaxis protein
VGMKMRPDVAIIDINLPKMDGRQVAEGLRHSLGEDVRLIAYTAYDESYAGRRGAAFNNWVTKPAGLPKLLPGLQGGDMVLNARSVSGLRCLMVPQVSR